MTEGTNKPIGAPTETVDTVVIGGSQSGLAVSYWLTQANHPHIVLERDRIGASWIDKRWDSFTLVTPNWMNRLPGFHYDGPDPDGFLSRVDIVSYLERYASSFLAPVERGVDVTRLIRQPDGSGYRVETNQGVLHAKNVVVTTGFFHKPKIPGFARGISWSIEQRPSSAYKNPTSLRSGAVLVVGSGQSGCQIAEELHEAGRKVYLCVSDAPREPRRYRGEDINYWFDKMGGFDRSFEDPDNPVERYRANPHCTGKNGGHAINLADFAAKGITLLGRVTDGAGYDLTLAPDLRQNLAKADKGSRDLMKAVDGYIAAAGLQVPPTDEENTDDGTAKGLPEVENIEALNLAKCGISSIIWATGYSCDFSWVDMPVLDDRGYPIQKRGVTPHPGLYFCGLHWMHCLKSGLFFGVGEAARHIASHLINRIRDTASAAA